MPAGYLLESDRFILRLLNQYPSHVLLANYTALNCNHDSHHLKQTLFFYQTPSMHVLLFHKIHYALVILFKF